MAFYEALHQALSTYAPFVHETGGPASDQRLREAAAGQGLPTAYADFLRSFDGARLFLESIVLYSAAELPARCINGLAAMAIGETQQGALLMDHGGALLLCDEDAPDPLLCGTSLERWLAATIARETMIITRDGDFREVFEGDGELIAHVRRRRAAAGRKRDPEAALYLLEEAELALEDQQPEAAQAALERAVALDPRGGPCLELLAALHRDAGRPEEAEALFLRAAAATPHPPLRASRLLDAALLSQQHRAAHGAAAWQADPGHAAALLAQARESLGEGDTATAEGLVQRILPLMEAAKAADSGPLATDLGAVQQQLRVRNALRLV